MKWSEIPAGIINGAQQRFFVALGDNADVVATRINTDSSFVERLAKFANNGGFEATTSQKKAREIMGKNFFGIEEAVKFFRINPNKKQLAYLAEIPFSEETLITCKNTHVLIAVFPISTLDIRSKVERKFFYSHEDAWYNKEKFAKNSGEVEWKLILKTPVENSTNKNWDEQQQLLSQNEETPTVQIMIYTIIGHYLNTGERLFESIYVRCSDLVSDGNRVLVGVFGGRGLGIDGYWDDVRDSIVGLSASRKSSDI